MCELLRVTPKQLGRLRSSDPVGIGFLEQYMVHEAKEKEKAYKDAKKKAKIGRKGRRH